MGHSTYGTSMWNTGTHYELFKVSTLAASAQSVFQTLHTSLPMHATSCQVSNESQQVQHSCLNSSFHIAKFGIKKSLIIRNEIFTFATRLCILSPPLLWVDSQPTQSPACRTITSVRGCSLPRSSGWTHNPPRPTSCSEEAT